MSEPTVRDYSEIYRLGRADERERIIEKLNHYSQHMLPEDAEFVQMIISLIKLDRK